MHTQAFHFRPQLVSHAYRRLGAMHAAQDVVQEAYLRWYQGDRSAVASPFSWLITVVNRLCVDYWRRSAKEAVLPEMLPDDAAFPGAWLEQSCDVVDAISLATALNEEQRAALILREVFDWSYEDIGRILGKTGVTCRQLVHRARVLLQRSHPQREVSADLAERLVAAVRNDDAQEALKLFSAVNSAA